MTFTLESIGVVRSCFKEKFAIPRQPGLVKAATASIELFSPYNKIEALRGLDEFSHLWLVFVFHQHLGKEWSPTVRPPRMEGRKRYGVFATRSSYRPNPIGLSLVKLEGIEQQQEQVLLHVSGVDLLDQTPLIDIKPYVPYCDSIPAATGGFTDRLETQPLYVSFSEKAKRQCLQAVDHFPQIEEFIRQLLSIDHRPYYMKKLPKTYSTRVYDYDLKWTVDDDKITVISLEPI